MPCHSIRNNTCALTVCLSLAVMAGPYPAWAQDTAVTQEKAKQEKSEPAKKEKTKAEKAEKAMPKKAREADRADPCRVEPDLPGCAKATNKNK